MNEQSGVLKELSCIISVRGIHVLCVRLVQLIPVKNRLRNLLVGTIAMRLFLTAGQRWIKKVNRLTYERKWFWSMLDMKREV